MADTIQIPFRINQSGSVATIADNSDDVVNQDIAAAVLTHYQERPLFPAYGIPDPSFSRLDQTRLAATIAAYGPRVRITKIETTNETEATQNVVVEWDRGN